MTDGKPLEASSRIQLQRDALLRDLDTLQRQQLTKHTVLDSNRSWGQAMKDTLKVAKPQLINIMATFMMVVMSMQVYSTKKEQKVIVQKKEEELKVLREKLEELQGLEFAKRLAHVIQEQSETNEAENGVETWSLFSGRRLLKTSSSAKLSSKSKEEEEQLVHRLQLEISARVMDEGSNTNPTSFISKNEIVRSTETVSDEELDETKSLLREFQSNTLTESEDEIVRVEDNKIVKRKKFIL